MARLRWKQTLGVTTLIAVVGATASAGADARPQNRPSPEIGVTYTHLAIPANCDLSAASGLLKTYHVPGVRKRSQLQLAAMRAAGIDSIRILVWHLSEPSRNDTTNLPSAGGRLVEPYRANLIQFVTDVRVAGFKSLVVEYGPQWTNNPFGEWGPNGLVVDRWDRTKLEENWSFIHDTRGLIKRYGPVETWFDPASEFAPTDYIDSILGDRIDRYLAEMYRRYITAFGKDDIVFFLIAKRPSDEIDQEFRHLIRALQSTGFGLPKRFGVHPTQGSPTDLENLRDTDAAMRRLGLDQPLMIGEMLAEGANSAAIAHDIAQFADFSGRTVAQVYLWFTRSGSEPLGCVSAPYRADSYISALRGSPPSSTLSVSVRGQTVIFRTAYGQAVRALTAGDYRVVVRDASAKTNFRLVGPKVDLRTGRHFHGTRTWSVALRQGVYRFGSDGIPAKLRRTLTVLTAG